MNTAMFADAAPSMSSTPDSRPHLDSKPSLITILLFAVLLIGGVALLIALGFEFVNGFHHTANAVATVIYTHSLPPNVAVVWSGAFNFLGVLASSGAVAQVTQLSLADMSTAAAPADSRQALAEYLRTKQFSPVVIPALTDITRDIGAQIKASGSIKRLPAEAVANVRNDMYLASESIKFLQKDEGVSFTPEAKANLTAFKKEVDDATKFIPLWVKVAVAIALGLGTMVGWKRIVQTVGEKIGKTHLTYAQGASAELVAMTTIGAADIFGLPVSTTHVLSSGIAGTMAANRSGLQWGTIRNLLMAWVLTLPMAMLLSGSLYWLFTKIF